MEMKAIPGKGWLGSCAILATVAFLAGCGPQMPKPDEVVAPQPIPDNSGKIMCPYTQDGVAAKWVDKALNAKAGSAIGKTAGAFIGAKAFEQIPFVGGLFGSMVGEAIGRKIAISAAGGWDFIKANSDLSFNNVDDMAVFLYATYCGKHEHYPKVLDATMEIYPDLRKRYMNAIMRAPRKPPAPPAEVQPAPVDKPAEPPTDKPAEPPKPEEKPAEPPAAEAQPPKPPETAPAPVPAPVPDPAQP